MPANASISNQHPVSVTAMGLVSPLGIGRTENLQSLKTARDAVGPLTSFDASQCRCQTAAEIPDASLHMEGLPRRFRSMHRTARMMLLALQDAFPNGPGPPPDMVLIGTTSGGMTYGQDFAKSHGKGGGDRRNPARVANYLPQKPLLDALEAFGWSGIPCRIVANACASGTNALGEAFQLVRNGIFSKVLCGGYDAISELVHTGFDSLQAATPEKCRPFDADRSGMVLGEGAAFLMLEAGVHPGPGGLLGYGVSTDNYHLTQPNPDGSGPRRAMAAALEMARLQPGQIDYINAHGTATPFNDAAEGHAILELFGEHSVPVSSTKSAMGHSLGAAGAIEAVLTLHALNHDLLPANLHLNQPELALDLVANTPRSRKARVALSNSFGFGGANASVILEATST